MKSTSQYIVPAYVLFNLWAVLLITFLMMYFELGLYAALAAFFSTLMFVPLQFFIGKFILYLRLVLTDPFLPRSPLLCVEKLNV